MRSFFRTKNKGLRVGLCLTESSVSLVAIQYRDNALPIITDSFYYSIKDGGSIEDAQQQLIGYVEQHNLKHVDCYCVLSEKEYQLLLVEPPDVPEKELISAMQYKVKELINIDVDNVVIDVFQQPEKKMLYTVVVEKKIIARMVDFVNATGLSLVTIDIEELSCRNLWDHYPMNERGIAVLTIKENEGKILIIKQGNLYLSRRFSIHYGGGVFDSLPEDELILELQRSLDYYERQMGQSAPAEIIFCGMVKKEKITDIIKQSFQQNIQCVEITEFTQKENLVVADIEAMLISGAAARRRVA